MYKFVMMILVPPALISAMVFSPAPVAEPSAIDMAPFGFVTVQPEDNAVGLRWAEPRKINRIEVEFDEPTDPAPSGLQLQYWHRYWDGKPDPILSEQTSGKVGWDAMDDWTNGKWINAKTRTTVEGNRVTFQFEPIGNDEIKTAAGGLTYRKTLWVRLRGEKETPSTRGARIFTESGAVSQKVRIQFGKPNDSTFDSPSAETGRLEIFNGRILSIDSGDDTTSIDPEKRWTIPAGGAASVVADLLVARDAVDKRYDRTIVTVRCGKRSFSFAVDDLAGGERILVDDLGALVTTATDTISIDEYRGIVRREFGGRSVFDRIKTVEEQTLGRAWDEMPLKRPLYFVHGLPGSRNVMHQLPNGDIEIASESRWFNLPASDRDTRRQLWEGRALRIGLGLPPDWLRGGRELREGYLPQLRTWWQAGQVYYEQQSILAPMDGDYKDIALDDPSVLLMQIRVVNLSESERATASLRWASNAGREGNLRIVGNRVVSETADGPRTRWVIRTGDHGRFEAAGKTSQWSCELAAGQSVHLFLAIPSITVNDDEAAALAKLDFHAEADRVCAFWRDITSLGTQIQTPDSWLNDFYKAHLRHLLVNCYKEIGTDYLHAHVGTFHYGVYPNESVMMISDLDRRNYPDMARRNLDAFLRYQGSVMMNGNFRSKQGQFYGAGGHETGNYNKSHGYVMWNMGQHWRFTRDRQWMEKSAPGLIEACEWVLRERKTTQEPDGSGNRRIEYGFLPSGSLEDVTDYWYWLATNSATVWGFCELADALADYGHPEGARLQKEAKAYFDDCMAAINESSIRCAVVSLRDHTWVPKIPSELYQRGRSHGWLREVLEGSLFLPAYGLLEPDDPRTRWILKDYEDNLYISDRYGYGIPAYEDFWFSRGGFSQQANLLDGPLPYLWRDEIEHYLRAFFNGFASAFYPEIRMCNEHSLPELGYPRGDHFKSSDEAQVTYWLRLMFINERKDALYLGQAIPRAWLAAGKAASIANAATHFGPMSLSYQSIDDHRIEVTLEPPKRNPPKTIYLRIRHPKKKPIQSIVCNDKPWTDIDKDNEWIVLPGRLDTPQKILVHY